MGATLEALIAAFCRLDKSLSCCWEKGWLVGAVGIEIASLLHKDLHGNDLVPLPHFQLLLNVVKHLTAWMEQKCKT
jgi:hypothetical protein